MSLRNDIAQNIMDNLQNISSPNIAVVTREPFDFERLSNHQFPAILIRTATEDRSDNTLGGSNSHRMATIDYQLVCYLKASAIDFARNNLIEAIEEKLEEDRTRNGKALDTQVINIEIDEGNLRPVGGILITLRVLYSYQRGST